ncbi:unnamed protein product [Pelagomonas calceolata]|uniref:U3 small nucleolar RNA-associated protein 14 n=2 Tax=Pelagomonas calceolata TaxID=35677 RepID=A0A8J2SZL9_9STRA|nr:unnamed protein product [Pelagomonas calceolata]
MSLTLDDLAATSGTAAQDLALKSKELTQKQVVAVPVAHATERRAQRQLAYDETKKTADQWDDTIDAERKTSSLNFGKREAEQTSTSQLASSFFADTPLERRVEQILQQASAHTDQAVQAREDEALEERDDADERRKELAKTRSLLFFAERKAKYHAKVKSKAYARLRRKRLKKRDEAAREAAAEADPSLREARDDELATKRAQERMDLRHASTSAWARSTKMRGRGAVESRRREMRDNEALRRELAKKQEQSSSEDESDSDESREELIAKAKASLGECVDEEQPGGALLNMKFMVKAREAQRARAREDAERLLEELEAGNASSDDDDEDGAALRELAALSGDAPAEAEAPPTVALQGNSLKVRRKRGAAAAAAAPAAAPAAADGTGAATKKARAAAAEAPASGGEGAWLAAARKARARGRAVSQKHVEVEPPRLRTGSVTQAPEESAPPPPTENAPLTKLSQQDLLHMAFDDKDQEDFAAQRSEELAPERPPEQPDLLGWGSWAGEGAPAARPKKKRKEAPVTIVPPTRAAANPRVILNAKRHKKAGLLKVAQVPYPFTSRSEYERYMARPVGNDWNAAPAVKKLTRPAVSVRAGAAVEPIRKGGGKKKGLV